jgi:hypothetical protein
MREWRDVIGFQVSSKELVDFKAGPGSPKDRKTNLSIPEWVWKESRETDFVRGFLETDGGVYLENKYGKKYPRINLSTTCKPLAVDLKKVIEENGLTCSLWKQEYDNG